MKKVVLSQGLFNEIMGQLSIFAEFADDSEGHLAGIMADAKEAAEKSSPALDTVHELICEKEGYDCDEEQSDALEIIFG